MDSLLANIPKWIELVCLTVTALVAVATIIVRLPYFKRYESKVVGVQTKVQKVLAWLPTIGVNPRTKELEEKIKEVGTTPKETVEEPKKEEVSTEA